MYLLLNKGEQLGKKCAVLAEQFALRVTKKQGKKKDRKAAGPWVHAIIANPDLDLETWDGNMWSTDSDFYTEEESDAKMGGVHGAPVFKRKLVTRENGQAVWTDELTDYSSEEVKNLLEKYRQRPREKPQN